MKIFENKNIFKKLVIVFLIITLFSFCIPKGVKADGGIGGQLLDPLLSMFVGLGDGAIALLQKLILQQDASMIQVDTSTSTIAKVLGIFIAVVVVVGGIAALVATGRCVIGIYFGFTCFKIWSSCWYCYILCYNIYDKCSIARGLCFTTN